MRVAANPHNRIEETTQFTFYFTTVDYGKSAPANPTANAKATSAKAYELASTCLPKEWEKREPELPSIFATTPHHWEPECSGHSVLAEMEIGAT